MSKPKVPATKSGAQANSDGDSPKRVAGKRRAQMAPAKERAAELVIVSGLSGSGKGTMLRALEDLGYYAVDNLPIELIPTFAELTFNSPQIRSAALVVDAREGATIRQFPTILQEIKKTIPTKLVFLEAEEPTILRRFSETRRPHPLSDGAERVAASVKREKKMLAPMRALADLIVDTSRFNIHELREFIGERLGFSRDESQILIYVTSFGYRHGIPTDSDLVLDVRFLPNPNYIPEYKDLTGKNPKVAQYVRSFPQTNEFMERITDLLQYLLPHYVEEGKSYLTISFGCTGGHHRSVMMAEEIRKRLAKLTYNVKVLHRDIEK